MGVERQGEKKGGRWELRDKEREKEEGGVERQGQKRWKGELRDKDRKGGRGVERQGQKRWKGELRDKNRKGGRGS